LGVPVYHYDQEFLSWIAEAEDEEIRAIAARYAEAPAFYERYLDDPAVMVLRELARNRDLSGDFKLRLARHTDDQDTLANLADKTQNEELFLLCAEKITSNHAIDPIRCHQQMLARPSVQDRLCTHPVPHIRWTLARKENLSAYAREKLSQDPLEDIRSQLKG
jgi:hypothetical protein